MEMSMARLMASSIITGEAQKIQKRQKVEGGKKSSKEVPERQ